MLPIPSSNITFLASICLSTGRTSAAIDGPALFIALLSSTFDIGEVGAHLGPAEGRWLRPLRSRLKDSLRDFLKDFRRDIGCSPVPDTSFGLRVHFATTSFLTV
jgi:hypothetical protein